MGKVLKNFYIGGLFKALALYLVCFVLFSTAFTAYKPALEAQIAAAEEAARAKLTGEETFSKLEDAILVAGVQEVSASPSRKLIVKTEARGLEAMIGLSVAIDENGQITGILKEYSNEAPEYGEMALQENYFSNYYGLTETSSVDAYTGATYTSDAIRGCVDAALLQSQVQNGLVDARDYVELTDEETIALFLDEQLGDGWKAVNVAPINTVQAVYQSDKGYAFFTERVGYYEDPEQPIKLLICLDNDGVITRVNVVDHAECPAYGEKAMSENYLFLYEGATNVGVFDPGDGTRIIDMFSCATLTSMSILMQVRDAIAQYALLNPVEAE